MLHSASTRAASAKLAVVHCLVMGGVVAICAAHFGRFDTFTIAALISLVVWSATIPLFPWGRHSHNWLAKIYFLGAAWFVLFAIHLDNLYLLLGIWPEMVVFADAYWYRRSLLVVHQTILIAAFAIAALVIGGAGVGAFTLIALPLMTATALTVGAISHRFIQTLLQRAQFQSAVTSLLEALHARDGYTGEHSRETLALSMAVADQLRLDDLERKQLSDTALLHDIGKIGIPNAILQKPGSLDADEWAKMQRHPEIGEEILREIPGFEAIADAVRHEHERWDGQGYPDGLAATEIPLASRIVLVCDAYHAMTSDRPYRKRMPKEEARAELRRNAGTQFDPAMVAALDCAIELGAIEQADRHVGSQVSTLKLDFGIDEEQIDFRVSLGLQQQTVRKQKRENLNDPQAMITLTAGNWLLIALMMAVYLAVVPPFGLFGLGVIGLCLAIAATSIYLRSHGAPKEWSLATGLFAFALAPLTAAHFDQPAMLVLALGPAVTTSAFFWHRVPIRILQSALVIGGFVAMPIAIFGMKLLPMAATGARAFPGVLLVAGHFTQKLIELRFERRRFTGTMTSLLLALQARDGYTGEHSDQTLKMAMAVADEMELGEEDRLELKDVALLHDIGKIGIPDEILNKPSALDEREWEIMRRHTAIGEQIVARVPGFESVARAIRHEHERWDGTGYPDGISGEQIPLSSRIVLVCDAFHAMTSDRPYRKAISATEARAEMVQCAGSQFDPRAVGALLTVLDEEADQRAAENSAALVHAA